MTQGVPSWTHESAARYRYGHRLSTSTGRETSMDKVSVTGGTGFIGVERGEALCRMGYRLQVPTRCRHRAALLSTSPIEVVGGGGGAGRGGRRGGEGGGGRAKRKGGTAGGGRVTQRQAGDPSRTRRVTARSMALSERDRRAS